MGWSIDDVKQVTNSPIGQATATALGGPLGYMATGGDLTGAGSAKKAQGALNQTEEEANKAYQESLAQIKADQTKQESINKQMDQTASAYKNLGDTYSNTYDSQIGKLLTDAEGQHDDARKTYQNSIQPALKNNMEVAQKNAMSSMTLQEAQDPNNTLQSGIRGYFNDQSAGAMRQGGQSAGIADAFAGQQMGLQGQSGAPQTGAQQQNAYANASSQGNQVRGNTMGKAASLQDQGIQTAQAANDTMYDQGIQAQGQAAGAANDYQQGYLNFNDIMQGSRGGISSMQGSKLGNTLGNVESGYATDQATQQRRSQAEEDAINNQLAAMNQKYGVQSGAKGASGQAYTGRAEGIGGLFNSGAGIAGMAGAMA